MLNTLVSIVIAASDPGQLCAVEDDAFQRAAAEADAAQSALMTPGTSYKENTASSNRYQRAMQARNATKASLDACQRRADAQAAKDAAAAREQEEAQARAYRESPEGKQAAADKARLAKEQADKKAAEDQEAADNAARAEEVAEWLKDQLDIVAQKSGMKPVVYDVGIMATVQSLVQGDQSLRDLKNTPIHVVDADLGMEIVQVLSQNDIIMEAAGFTIWLRNYAKNGGTGTAIEHGYLDALKLQNVVITGVKSYRTVLGGTKQAVVIERPHWNKAALDAMKKKAAQKDAELDAKAKALKEKRKAEGQR